MIWSIARRWSSRSRRRRSSASTCARSRLSAVAVAIGPTLPSALRLLPHALQLLLEGNHLQLATHDHFLEFLEIQNLLLQLALGLLQVANHLLVLAHVTQDADGADDLAFGVAQGRSVEGGGDDLAAGAAGVQAGVARDAALNDLAKGGGELAGLLGADEARQRLLDQLIRAEAEEGEDGVVGLQDLPLEIGDEDGVRRVLDEALCVSSGLVQLPHVAQNA